MGTATIAINWARIERTGRHRRSAGPVATPAARLRAVDKLVAHTAWGISAVDAFDQDMQRRIRRASIALLTNAACLDLPLRAWIQATAAVLRDLVSHLAAEPAHAAGRVLRSAAGQERVSARDFFAEPPAQLAQSVHDVKGASRDAVLVVPRSRTSPRYAAEADIWTAPMRGEPVAFDLAEERRILFVALTRARQYCAVGLPTGTATSTVQTFRAAGFRLA